MSRMIACAPVFFLLCAAESSVISPAVAQVAGVASAVFHCRRGCFRGASDAVRLRDWMRLGGHV